METLSTSLAAAPWVGALALGMLLLASYWTAARLDRGAPTWARAALAAAVWLAAPVVLFHVMAAPGLFRPAVALGTLAAWCAALTPRGGVDALRGAWRADRAALGRARVACARSPWGWLLLAPLALLGFAVVRALVSPPLAWDSLTYHYPRAAFWALDGGFSARPAPDAWGYYAWFPTGGDALWAWPFLMTGSDAWLGLTGLLAWAALPVGVVAAARGLAALRPGPSGDTTGAPFGPDGWIVAGLAATAVAFDPSVFAFAGTGYVDPTFTAAFALALALALRAIARPTPALLGAAVLPLATCATIKATGLPLLAGGVAALLVVAARAHGPGRRLAAALAALVAASAVALVDPLRAWVGTGNPLFPLPLHLPLVGDLPSSEELGLVLSGRIGPAAGAHFDAVRLLEQLFTPTDFPTRDGVVGLWLNHAPGAVLVAILGGLGIARARRRGALVTWLTAVACAALVLPVLLSSSTLALRTTWAGVLARLLAPVLVGLAVLATTAAATGRLARATLAAAAGIALITSLPAGLGPATTAAMGQAAVPLGAAAAVGVALFLARRSLRPPIAAAATLVAALAALGAISTIRADARWAIYEDAADGVAWAPHPVARHHLAAWPIWRALDAAGARVAFAAGWDGTGHNWLRAPLLGSGLANDVVYVPVTHDGRPTDYRDEAATLPALDEAAWLRRLDTLDVRFLVLALPPTPEHHWVSRHPAAFEPLIPVAQGRTVLYRIHGEALAADASQVAGGRQPLE